MHVGFEENNLKAAVSVVMAVAKQKNLTTVNFTDATGTRQFSLVVPDQVRDYLITATDSEYRRAMEETASGELTGKISATPYASVGVVFEDMPLLIKPEPVTRSDVRPAHLAYFWQNLS